MVIDFLIDDIPFIGIDYDLQIKVNSVCEAVKKPSRVTIKQMTFRRVYKKYLKYTVELETSAACYVSLHGASVI
jgi:hypothetical protein